MITAHGILEAIILDSELNKSEILNILHEIVRVGFDYTACI